MKIVNKMNRLILLSALTLSFTSCKMNTLKLAEHYSDLTMPKSAKVDSIVDLENERGNKVLYIKIKFANEDLLILTNEISYKNYKKLPIDETIITPEQNGVKILKYLSIENQKEFLLLNSNNQKVVGYYHLNIDQLFRKMEITIVDELKNEIIIYVLIL